MEDQPADSGDLTTDAAETDEATGAKAPRRRHRMPLRGQLAASEESSAEEAADEPSEPELEAKPAPRRRWWNFRRAKVPDEIADTTTESVEFEDTKPATRTPVGKAGRTAKTVAPAEPASEDEPVEQAAETEAAEPEEATEPSKLPSPT